MKNYWKMSDFSIGEIAKMIEEGMKARKSRESVLNPGMGLMPIFLF